MSRKIKQIPFYPILFAAFPVLALLGTNIHEVNPGVALRSLFISLAGALVILLIARLILGNQAIYASITPVNSFRVIFNTYFGGDYELLPDISYNTTGEAVPETYPQCVNP